MHSCENCIHALAVKVLLNELCRKDTKKTGFFNCATQRGGSIPGYSGSKNQLHSSQGVYGRLKRILTGGFGQASSKSYLFVFLIRHFITERSEKCVWLSSRKLPSSNNPIT